MKYTIPARFIERILPYPPEQNRGKSTSFRAVNRLFPDFSKNDIVEYFLICQQVAMLYGSFGVVMVLLFDSFLGAGIVIDKQAFEKSPTIVITSFRNITFIPLLISMWVFYSRIKSSIDISKDRVPVTAPPQFLTDENNGNWVVRSFILLVAGFLLICLSNFAALSIVRYFSAYNDLRIIYVSLCLQAFCAASASTFLTMGCLLFEKSYKHFPSLQVQLREMLNKNKTKIRK